MNPPGTGLLTPLGLRNSLVVCDKSGHAKFPFSFVILSWGELWLTCPELSLNFLPEPRAIPYAFAAKPQRPVFGPP